MKKCNFISKNVVFTFVFAISFFAFSMIFASPDPDLGFKWIRGKTLDNNFSETDKVQNDEAMVEWQLDTAGRYTLEFFVEDDVKNVLYFEKSMNTIKFSYKILKFNGVSGQFDIDITDTYIDFDFKEWDFMNQEYIDPVIPVTEIKYTIDAGDTRTGKIFKVKNQTLKVYWDKNKDFMKVVYQGLMPNTVHPFKLYNDQALAKELEILRYIQFESRATHYINSSTDLKIIDITTHPDEVPGIRPGIRVEISKPRVYNNVSRKFDTYISNSDESNINMTINIQEKQFDTGSGDHPNYSVYKKLSELKEDDANPNQIKYYIDIVKTDSLGADFISWPLLKESTLYDPLTLIFTNQTGSKFDFEAEYKVTNGIGLGYTYLDYDIIRKNVTDTYAVINPYKGPGTYTVYMAETYLTDPNSLQLIKWAEHRVESEDDKIYVPLNVVRNEIAPNKFYTFKVVYNLNQASEGIESQLRVYDANKDTRITVDVPMVSKIKNLVVLPTDDLKDARIAKMTLEIERPANLFELLEGGDKQIWYEVLINSNLKDYININNPSGSEVYQIVRTFYFKRVGNRVELRLDSKDAAEYIEIDMSKDTFDVDIVLKDLNKDWAKFLVPDWTYQASDITKPTGGNVSGYVFGDSNYYRNSFFNPSTQKISNSYFLALKVYYDSNTNNITSDLTVSDFSIPISFSLSETREVIKLPSDIVINSVSKTHFEAGFTEVNIDEYIKKMLDPAGENLFSKRYEILFSTSQEDLERVLKEDAIKDKEKLEMGQIYKFIHLGSLLKDPITGILNVNVNASQGASPNINEVRDNSVFAFYSDSAKFKIDGLDANTNYFFAIRTALEIEVDSNGDGVLDSTSMKFSEITSINSVRTTASIVIPGEDEKNPLTPNNFRLEEKTTDRYVHIRWEKPDMVINDDEAIGYEILRVADERLEEADRSNLFEIKDVLEEGYKGCEAFRVIDDKLYKYNNAANIWEIASDDDIYENVVTGAYMRLKDMNIDTNRVYYYYIRTIKFGVSNNGSEDIYTDKAKSFWAELTSTTLPVTGIRNLKSVYSGYSYDSYYETVISFDAPVTDPSQIPSIYDFGIAVREQDDADYSETKYSKVQLSVSDVSADGYRTYVYKIRNLKAGKKYYIKVCVIDKAAGSDTGDVARSPYSSYIEIRTMFNQEDYDKENKYADYLEYFMNEANKLLNKVYYTVYDDSSSFAVKFKEEKFTGEINATRTTYYDLPVKDGTKNLIYYIPKKNIDDIKDKKLALRIMIGNVSIVIPYEFIDDEEAKAVSEALENIKDRYSDTEDYYVRISLNTSKATGSMSGYKISSDQYKIDIDVIEQNRLNIDIDYIIEELLRDDIEWQKSSFLNELDRRLGGKIDDKEFLYIVEEELSELEERFLDTLQDELDRYEEDQTAVKEVYKKISIKFDNASKQSKIIEYNTSQRKWQLTSSENYLGSVSHYLSNVYPVALAEPNDLVSIYGSDEDKEIAMIKSKYNLDAVLRQNGVYDLNGNVTKKLFNDLTYAIIATESSDVFEQAALRKKIDSMYNFKNDPLSSQEVVYGIMQLYNMYTSVDINRMTIKNLSLLNEIVGINEYYKQSILAGIELGKVKKTDVALPNKKISINETLRILYRVLY